MSDQLAADAAQASEGLTAPEAASSVEDVNSATAPESADPAAALPSVEGDAAEAPTANDQGTQQPAKAKPTARDRIAEVIAERNAERERTTAAAEAAEFWRKKALGESPATETTQEKPAPKLADFEFDTDKWAEAHAKWADERIEQRANAAAQRLLDARSKTDAQQSVIQKFEAREAEFEKTAPDYRAVTGDPRLAEFATPTIAQVMAVSEVGPQLGYHLAKNPEELARISRLAPLEQARALGRIEASIAKSAPPPAVKKTVTTTRAPAPPSPVGGAVASKTLGDMDIHEYMANRTWARPQ